MAGEALEGVVALHDAGVGAHRPPHHQGAGHAATGQRRPAACRAPCRLFPGMADARARRRFGSHSTAVAARPACPPWCIWPSAGTPKAGTRSSRNWPRWTCCYTTDRMPARSSRPDPRSAPGTHPEAVITDDRTSNEAATPDSLADAAADRSAATQTGRSRVYAHRFRSRRRRDDLAAVPGWARRPGCRVGRRLREGSWRPGPVRQITWPSGEKNLAVAIPTTQDRIVHRSRLRSTPNPGVR